jgi:hypothetical protein
MEKIVKNIVDRVEDDYKRYRFYLFIMKLVGHGIYRSYSKET